MGYSAFDDHERPAWNAGRKIGAKRALKQKEVWAIRFWLKQEGRLRDRALFDLAIDSKLRGCDLVRIRIGDLVTGDAIRERALVIRRKTSRPVQFEMLQPARSAPLTWLKRRSGSIEDYAFPSRCNLSTRQYGRLVDEWVSAVGLKPQDYGTHSLRRTKAAMINKQTATCEQCKSSWVPQRSRARCAISASTPRTPSSAPRRPKCELSAAAPAAAL